MVNLSEKVQNFAKWSGAKIKPHEETVLEYDIPDFVDDSAPVESVSKESAAEEKGSLVKERFSKSRKPWQNPKITLPVAIAVCGGIVALLSATVLADFKWGGIGDQSIDVKAKDPETELTGHKDGEFQTAAIAGPLGQGFSNDPVPDKTPNKKPVKAANKVVKHSPNAARSAIPVTTPVVASTAPRVRATPIYSDYGSAGRASMPTRSLRSTPVYQAPQPQRINTAPVPDRQQQTAEERRQQAIAATTFSGGSSNGGNTDSGAIASNSATNVASTSSDAKPQYLAAENAVLDGVPQQLIDRAKKSEGILLQGLAFTPGDLKYLEGQEITAEISNPLDSGLPAGTQVIAAVRFPESQAQAKNAVVMLVPTAIVINGNEYEIPEKSAILMGKNGKPLIAKRGGSEFFRFLGSATKTVLGGAVGGLTSLIGGGSNILSSLGGLGGGLRGGGSQPNPTEALILKPQTPIQFSIIRPFSIPVASTENIQHLTSTENIEPVAEAPQPKRFAQDLSDAELMAIVNQPEEYTNAQ